MPACSVNAGTLTCNLGNLAAGATIQIKVLVVAPATSGVISSPIQIHTTETEANPADNQITVDILIL